MAKTSLVIVESPTKAKTIRKFLPKSFIVEASMGHIRDLPESAADIPAKYKKMEWARIGVDVENNFEPLYVLSKRKSKVIADLRAKLERADELFLATDEDREGESIAWHLVQALKPKIPVKRMVFHEITKSAIEQALEKTRKLDTRLIEAQEARRILDRLYGYTLSPLIWKKIAFGLSAGRVQSVALRLIVQRERERTKFVKGSYWDLLAQLEKKDAQDGEEFQAKLLSVGGVRVATGKDFDENTGQIFSDKKLGKDLILIDESAAKRLSEKVKKLPWSVESVTEKPINSRPAPPFITSTLQQEANRKLGLSARDAMRTAQRLYEEGLITYMRTDSPSLSSEAIKAARGAVVDLYGKEYLSDEARQYSAKSKGAQEAHEAIRPAGSEFVHPKDSGLSGAERALYELIWKRTVATQMAEARKLSINAQIKVDDAIFSASGIRILFPGFLRAYVEGRDDPDAALEDQEIALPNMKSGDVLKFKNVEPVGHETKAPARFTEASLVQTLEKEGIGRPSTYASIIGTIQERGYVRRVATALVPTFTGYAVTQLLEKNFEKLVDPAFTSKMEESLDEIAEGNLESLPYLKQFYLGKDGLQNQVKVKDKSINADDSRIINFPSITGVQIRVGRFGPYIVKLDPDGKTKKSADDEVRASIPEDISPADLKPENIEEILLLSKKGPQAIGVHPKTGENIYVLLGRFGPYVQQGEIVEDKPKPRRASIPKGTDPKTLSMDRALELLSLPRELGVHPTSGKPVNANLGRFGPYVVHDGDFRSLKKEDNVYSVSLSRALELLAMEKVGRGNAKLLKALGAHPDDGKPVQLYEGKFGPYLKYKSVSASLPKELKPEAVTLADALKVLATKSGGAKGGAQSRGQSGGQSGGKRGGKRASKGGTTMSSKRIVKKSPRFGKNAKRQ